MRRMNFLAILLLSVSTSSSAFFNLNNWSSPFSSGTGHYNNIPWSGNSKWNPFSTGNQFSPENDARNLAKYGSKPKALEKYRSNSNYVSKMPAYVVPEVVKPSNWLTETDFGSTLEKISSTGGKDFFVNQPSFGQEIQKIKDESLKIDQAVREYMQKYSNESLGSVDSIYGKQGYALSPAAVSTTRIENN